MRRLPFATVPALVLAACVPSAAPPVASVPTPVPVVALPALAPAGDWQDWPVSPGTWAYRRDARGSIALFGPAGGDARMTLRCDASARRVYLSVPGQAAGGLAIRTSSTTRTLAMQPTGGTLPYVAVALAPADPLLDAMAFSRGHFTAEPRGAAPLVVPAWAEIGRVIEDCRG